MATIFSHGIVADLAVRLTGQPVRRIWYAAVACAIIPDIDVIGFRPGIGYADMLGHRGLSHSLVFAAVAGSLAAAVVRRG